jgi:putative transposase
LRVLFILVVLAHDRRRVVHFNVTERPTAGWTAQQIVEAFPDDTAPAYLLRDRDRIYGHAFRHRVKGIGIRDVLTAPQSPWQNPFAERLIGSIRRECLDHVLVLSERHLHRILTRYFAYYHRARTHLALQKDAPDGRPIERLEVGNGRADSSRRRSASSLRSPDGVTARHHSPVRGRIKYDRHVFALARLPEGETSLPA